MRLACLVLLIPAVATAAPAEVGFELIDRGDAFEVVAHNVKAAKTSIAPIRSRLEVPIVGRPVIRRLVPTDSTVKMIELDGEGPRVLSVKVGFEHADVKLLARYAQAIQIGEDLHLLVPRQLPAEGQIVKLPEPTLPPLFATPAAGPVTAQIEAVGPIQTPPGIEPVRRAPVVEKPQPTSTPATQALETPAPPPATPPLDSQLASADRDGMWSKLSMCGALGFAALGCGLWILRRRRAAIAPGSTIEVIAQRSLGGKSRIVWLSAGPREMLVAVSAQQVRMLGQWRKQDAPAALPEAQAISEPRAEKPSSPAVSGILRLRATTQAPPVNEEVATGDVDADSLWAQEILAATGARR